MLVSLSKISNDNLTAKLKKLKGEENLSAANIVRYLSEFDTRKLYRELGYSSLFAYCTECLGYSEGAAYRRISAARLFRTNPEIYESIKSGKLNLTVVAEIAKIKEETDKKTLLKESEGKSTRAVQAMTVKYQPPSLPKRETVRAKQVIVNNEPDLFTDSGPKEVKECFSITMQVDKEFMELLEETKALMGFKVTSEVLRKTLKEYVEKKTKIKREVKVSEPKNSRFIPKVVKISVRERDRQCSFVSKDGRRCCETKGLQFDHVIPFAVGGTNSETNIRLLCGAHNRLMSERFFGQMSFC